MADKEMSTSVCCPDCQKIFLHPRNLLQHRRVQHEGVRYYCQDCNLSYTRQYNLTHHRLKSHPDKMPPAEVKFLKRKLLFPVMAAQFRRGLQPKAVVAARRRLRKPVFVRQILRRLPPSTPPTAPLVSTVASVDRHVRTCPPVADNGATATAHVVCGGAPLQLAVSRRRASPLAAVSSAKKLHNRQCSLCPFKSVDDALYRRHTRRHNLAAQPSVHTCRFCSYSNGDENAVLRHSAVHFAVNKAAMTANRAPVGFPIAPAGFRCRCCARQFSDFNELLDHQKLHTT